MATDDKGVPHQFSAPQLGISCRYTGPVTPHLHMALFPDKSEWLPKASHRLVAERERWILRTVTTFKAEFMAGWDWGRLPASRLQMPHAVCHMNLM